MGAPPPGHGAEGSYIRSRPCRAHLIEGFGSGGGLARPVSVGRMAVDQGAADLSGPVEIRRVVESPTGDEYDLHQAGQAVAERRVGSWSFPASCRSPPGSSRGPPGPCRDTSPARRVEPDGPESREGDPEAPLAPGRGESGRCLAHVGDGRRGGDLASSSWPVGIEEGVSVGERALGRLQEVPASRGGVELEQGQADPRGPMGQAGQRRLGPPRPGGGLGVPGREAIPERRRPTQRLAEGDGPIETGIEAGGPGQVEQRGIAAALPPSTSKGCEAGTVAAARSRIETASAWSPVCPVSTPTFQAAQATPRSPRKNEYGEGDSGIGERPSCRIER